MIQNPKNILSIAAISLIVILLTTFDCHAQTKYFRGDTSNVTTLLETVDGVRDTVYLLKERKRRNGQVIIYSDAKMTVKAMECTYRQGEHQGTDRYYYASGAVKKKLEVEEGWFTDSVFAKTSDTTKVFLHAKTYWSKRNCGSYSYWFPSGQIRCQGSFQELDGSECIETGQWYYWFADGKVKKVVTYGEKGLMSGTYKEFYKNGKLKLEGIYYADLVKNTSYRHDTWKVYDMEGNLIREMRYLLGMKVAE